MTPNQYRGGIPTLSAQVSPPKGAPELPISRSPARGPWGERKQGRSKEKEERKKERKKEKRDKGKGERKKGRKKERQKENRKEE